MCDNVIHLCLGSGCLGVNALKKMCLFHVCEFDGVLRIPCDGMVTVVPILAKNTVVLEVRDLKREVFLVILKYDLRSCEKPKTYFVPAVGVKDPQWPASCRRSEPVKTYECLAYERSCGAAVK